MDGTALDSLQLYQAAPLIHQGLEKLTGLELLVSPPIPAHGCWELPPGWQREGGPCLGGVWDLCWHSWQPVQRPGWPGTAPLGLLGELEIAVQAFGCAWHPGHGPTALQQGLRGDGCVRERAGAGDSQGQADWGSPEMEGGSPGSPDYCPFLCRLVPQQQQHPGVRLQLPQRQPPGGAWGPAHGAWLGARGKDLAGPTMLRPPQHPQGCRPESGPDPWHGAGGGSMCRNPSSLNAQSHSHALCPCCSVVGGCTHPLDAWTPPTLLESMVPPTAASYLAGLSHHHPGCPDALAGGEPHATVSLLPLCLQAQPLEPWLQPPVAFPTSGWPELETNTLHLLQTPLAQRLMMQESSLAQFAQQSAATLPTITLGLPATTSGRVGSWGTGSWVPAGQGYPLPGVSWL